MISFEDVASGITLPSDYLGVVFLQPFLRLTPAEPFKWRDEHIDDQIGALRQTLELASSRPHACSKTHFTVFPEYSIPGPTGVAEVQKVLESANWPSESVVLGGIDGLTKRQYSELYSHATTVQCALSTPDRVPSSSWVNCCIVWVKGPDNALRRWLQPKLRSAWPELNFQHQHMYEGNHIHLFSGKFEDRTPFHFFPLVCFDWIGRFGDSAGIAAVAASRFLEKFV